MLNHDRATYEKYCHFSSAGVDHYLRQMNIPKSAKWPQSQGSPAVDGPCQSGPLLLVTHQKYFIS